MRDHPRIEEWITVALAGSGLPPDRRAEIAEELRGHLEQSIDRKCEAGLSREQAIEAALAEFGPARTIRHRLRRLQWRQNLRHGLTEVRRHILLNAALSAAFSVLMAATSLVYKPETATTLMRCLGTLCVFTTMFALMTASGYIAAVCESPLRARRLRDEYRFWRSLTRWTTLVALGFVAMVPVLMVTLANIALFEGKSPLDRDYLWLWYRSLAQAWWESAGPEIGLLLGSVGFGLALALYERSRCVDEPSLPAVG
jgi:hypothetical protein